MSTPLRVSGARGAAGSIAAALFGQLGIGQLDPTWGAMTRPFLRSREFSTGQAQPRGPRAGCFSTFRARKVAPAWGRS